MNKILEGLVVSLWEVRGENDTQEGRGGTHVVGYYLSEDEAKEAALTEGVFGMPSRHILKRECLRTQSPPYTSYLLQEVQISNIEVKLRERALAKLTEDEKRVLGLI